MGSYSIFIEPSAEEELRRAPFPFRRQLVQALHKLKINPRPTDAEPLELESYRLLVHGWLLVYDVDDGSKTVTVYRIYH